MNTPMTRSRHLTLTLAPPILVAIAALVWAISVKSQLPDPIATHFTGIPMRADGYSSFATIYMLPVLALSMCGIQLFTVFSNSTGPQARFLTGLGSASSFLMSALIPGTLWPQVGLASAEGMVIPGSVAAELFGLPILGGIALALVTPPSSISKEDSAADTSSLNLPAGSSAVWFGSASASKPMQAMMVLVSLSGVAIIVAAMIYAADGLVFRIAMGLAALSILLIPLMFLGVRVRIDDKGVHWRSTAGLPRGTVAYADIADVDAVDVKPGAWGGWGWRLGAEGTALIIRGGEALRLKRRNGRGFFVTVDDAKTGARAIREHLQK